MRLSDHFTLAELTRSIVAQSRGIDNTPSAAQIDNLRTLAATLEEVRELLGGKPMIITSGYRSPALNRAIGGSQTSDHSNGLAADFVCPGYGHVMHICEAIRDSGIQFDQLIYEQGSTDWVHLGIGTRMRRQVMSWSRAAGYTQGIRRLQR
ncbi:D-Ala-D-Ala carboxypeptidase family metallohydrolase [Paracandidimonas soli]|uniref:Peptidase M15-like protein n=1 Tax=Paracandidimonas soli TaxID=1917182 RepID=A0A4R3VE36_9BURK|nr:D-Ala-D-Ala carboxypeptidase family metallohydrolase [Paracandidimonas soli]TCV01918.1 peptidase M15-like protein [Paracandidimonas soli]